VIASSRASSSFPRLLAIVVLFASLFLSSIASALDSHKVRRVSSHDWRAIQDVISRQMNAFRLDDDEAAFSLASPGIREMFESASNFMEMVRSEYRPVYRPRTFRFLKPAVIDGEPVQAVEVVALDGAVSIAAFSLERQRNGSWRISGCRLLDSKQFAT
jgi:Domain of unknown function (DUF4864)